jgi:hypothetical protein
MAQVSEELIVQISAQITQLQEGMAAALATVTSSNAEMSAATAAASEAMVAEMSAVGVAAAGMGARVAEGALVAKESMEKVKAGFNGMLEFAAVGLGIEKAVESLKHLAERGVGLEHLSQQTGITVLKLSQLQYAAQNTEVSEGALNTGLAKLARTMTSAHEGQTKASASLAHFGITAANLHDPMFSMADALEKIADKTKAQGDGFLKTGEAQQVFGRGAAELIPLLNQGSDGMAKLAKASDAAGYSMDEKAQAAAKQAAAAFVELHLASQTMSKQFAVGLAPALSLIAGQMVEGMKDGGQLSEMFGALGTIIKGVITVVEALAAGFRIAFTFIIGEVFEAADAIKGMGSILADALTGNWGRIQGDWKSMTGSMSADWSAGVGQIKDTAAGAYNSIKAMWSDSPIKAGAGGEGADNGQGGTSDGKGGKAKKEKAVKAAKDMFAAMKAELTKAEVDEQVSDDKRLGFELAFWQAKLKTAKKGSAEYKQISNQVETLLLAQQRKAATTSAEIHKIEEQQAIRHANAMRDIKKTEIEARFSAGEIGKQQELAQLAALEEERFRMESEEMNRELELLKDKPVAWRQMTAQIEELNDAHLKIIAEQNKAAADAQAASITAALQPVTSAIQQSVNGMIAGTTTMKKALGNIFQSIMGEFVSMAVKMAQKWLVTEIQKTLATRMQTTIRSAMEKTAAKQSIASDAATGKSQITSAAATGAAKAYQAIVGIPYVGPILAPIAAGVAFVGIEAFASRLGSAAGGWGQVPHDQIASIHKDEMILPADIAGPMRAIAKGGAMGGGGTTVNLSTLDMRSVADALRRNPAALAGAVQHANRMGHF